MSPVEQLQLILHGLAFVPQRHEEGQGLLAVGRRVIPLAAYIDVVRLHIENELILGPLLFVRFLIFYFGSVHGKAVAEDLVQSEQSSGHAAARSEKSPSAQPLSPGGPFTNLGEPELVFLLLRRLRRRDELFVGNDPGRDRWRGVNLGVEITLAYPH